MSCISAWSYSSTRAHVYRYRYDTRHQNMGNRYDHDSMHHIRKVTGNRVHYTCDCARVRWKNKQYVMLQILRAAPLIDSAFSTPHSTHSTIPRTPRTSQCSPFLTHLRWKTSTRQTQNKQNPANKKRRFPFTRTGASLHCIVGQQWDRNASKPAPLPSKHK